MTTVETDQAEVRALLQRLLDAWKKNDGDAFAAEFAEDGDLIMFNGMHTRGRVQIALVMQTLFDTILKESSVAANVKDLRLLNADTALLVTLGASSCSGDQGAARAPRDPDVRSHPDRRQVAVRVVPEYPHSTMMAPAACARRGVMS
ncbi:MAG: SgcJ/EcaC family oxidoreductase [Planctomycetota bacterium]